MSTEGFSVACPTCEAALKVRDESAVGQIFACPKCGSMVLVEAPVAEGESAAANDAGTELTDAMPSPSTVSRSPMLFGLVATGLMAVSGIAGYVWLHDATDEPVATKAPVNVDVSSEQPDASAPSDPATDRMDVPDDNAPNKAPHEIAAKEPLESVDVEEPTPPAELTPPPETRVALKPPMPPSAADADSLANIAKLLAGEPLTQDRDQPQTTSDLPVVALANQSGPATSASEEERAGRPITERLSTPLRNVRLEKVPLIDFCRTMMQIAGVPIQVDAAALRRSGNVLETPVTLVGADKTALDILRAALEPIRMLPVVEEQGVRISSPRTEDHRVGQQSLFVGDLQNGRGRTLSLTDFVTTLVEPGTWAPEGPGTIELKGERLVVNHTDAVRIETLILLEKLRAVRSLRPRRKLPRRYVDLESQWSLVNRYLDRSISMNVWYDQPLPDVVRQLEKASGLRVTVDWKALAEAGVSPESTAVLYARETTASQVFEQLAGSVPDATWVPISGDAMQLTTKQAMAERAYVEFYSLDMLGASGRQKVMQLGPDASSVMDPDSDAAIVRATSRIHRELAE